MRGEEMLGTDTIGSIQCRASTERRWPSQSLTLIKRSLGTRHLLSTVHVIRSRLPNRFEPHWLDNRRSLRRLHLAVVIGVKVVAPADMGDGCDG